MGIAQRIIGTIFYIPCEILFSIIGRPEEWAYLLEVDARPLLGDDEFYAVHYEARNVSREIPIRLRKLYARSLGRAWLKVQPRDKFTDAYGDLDFADLLDDVQDEFGIVIPELERDEMDGSFDSVVMLLAKHCSSKT